MLSTIGYDLQALEDYYKETRLVNFLGPRCFLNKEDYLAQTPELHPFGTLTYGGQLGVGFTEKWVNADGSIAVWVWPNSGQITGIKAIKRE